MLPPGVNSKLQDDDPRQKVSAYKESGLLLTIEVGKLIERLKKWDLAAVEHREKKLIKWARSEWSDQAGKI